MPGNETRNKKKIENSKVENSLLNPKVPDFSSPPQGGGFRWGLPETRNTESNP